ncbi:hypothetical protein GDO78_018880, partial [Eleutherodactylus coqui]
MHVYPVRRQAATRLIYNIKMANIIFSLQAANSESIMECTVDILFKPRERIIERGSSSSAYIFRTYKAVSRRATNVIGTALADFDLIFGHMPLSVVVTTAEQLVPSLQFALADSPLTVCMVSLQEREEAASMFKGKRGAQLAKDIARRSKTFTPGAGLQAEKKKSGPSPSDVEAIK